MQENTPNTLLMGIDLELTARKSDTYSTGLLWCKRGNTFVYYINECR